MTPIVITAPIVEPFTLAQARTFLRLDLPGFPGDTSQDPLIASWIRAGRQWIERSIDRSIGEQTLMVTLDSFTPARCVAESRALVELPLGPVRSIVSIEYIAPGETAPDVFLSVPPSAYHLTAAAPQRVVLRSGAAWPSARGEFEAVRIKYVAGYAVGDDVSGEKVGDDLLAAMRLLLGHFWLNRQAITPSSTAAAQELPLGVQALLWPNRASVGI